mmetsp:Transcript_19348/g.52662  ORF Transcript_19348/g.52662 Transcript_19348/m.52662 type:complete len:281 (-) Transcript_19348:776-1618(-)
MAGALALLCPGQRRLLRHLARPTLLRRLARPALLRSRVLQGRLPRHPARPTRVRRHLDHVRRDVRALGSANLPCNGALCGGDLLLEAPLNLRDVVLDEDEHRASVVLLHFEQLGREVFVLNRAGAGSVQDAEHQRHVALSDVQGRKRIMELLVPIETGSELLPGEVAAPIRVELLAHTRKLLSGLLVLLRLVLRDPVIVLLARPHGRIHDHRENHVHDGKVHGDKDRGEEQSCEWGLLDNRYRNKPPTIPCDDLLHKCETGLGHARKGALAPVAACVQAL